MKMSFKASVFRVDPAGLTTPSIRRPVLRRDSACGHRTLGKAVRRECIGNHPFGLQTKLEINDPGDAFEQEADRVADLVTTIPDSNAGTSRFGRSFAGVPVRAHDALPVKPHPIQRFAEDEEEQQSDERLPDEPLHLKRETHAASPMPNALRDGLKQSSGSPLPAATRRYMEPRFGQDFSRVRVHTGSLAHRMSVAIGAAAFTRRNDIFFRDGRFAPETVSGRHLIAHELTHVIQQGGGSSARGLALSSAAGRIQRRAEVHVNLHGIDRVKVYRESAATLGGTSGFLASSGRSGHRTRLGDHTITHKRPDPTAKIGVWGLRYFATFYSDQGFHSRLTWPTRRKMCSEFRRHCTPASALNRRVRHELTVNGSELSHGCVRLHEDDAHALFDAVAKGTPVKIYREARFRASPFPSGGGGRTGDTASGGRIHRVVAGDTLGEIAEHYGVTVDALRSANGIPAGSSHIEAGQELVIPDQ
jgi:Domain of unknown function (DUF4157)/L,D-transpeptidase catalytic domain/LysM domain